MNEKERAVMEQALEFCESVHGGCTDSDDGAVEAITVWCPEIIEALRTVLARPVEPVEPAFYGFMGADVEHQQQIVNLLRPRWPVPLKQGALINGCRTNGILVLYFRRSRTSWSGCWILSVPCSSVFKR